MPRPKRPRHIISPPAVDSFGPRGFRGDPLIILSLEEFEAIRLIDYTGMDQSEASTIMNVSRQTVGRILKTARIKVARALVEGQGLKVEGGCYRIGRPGGGRGPGRGQGRGRRGMGRGGGPGKGRGQGRT